MFALRSLTTALKTEWQTQLQSGTLCFSAAGAEERIFIRVICDDTVNICQHLSTFVNCQAFFDIGHIFLLDIGAACIQLR